ncbi:hypothetical protein CCHR01_11870 [Colletotrichum chrysophilum]|uniref:Uncharacterized protein n=1 Tax=Colletotrichum chrysophilum TaxID=1836956 RepID=A0AAD9ADP7_9PEZI|nr:hypothetical protein CCHR01_11870 [Colletotrichum chrysophilum]
MDLLDFSDGKTDEVPAVEARLRSATRVEGLVLLQNFAPLVAKRSYDKQERCDEITKFIEVLEAYPGPIILCLEKSDAVDWKLRKLGPVYIDLDDASQE